jgi:hypothetical protein
MLRNMLLAALLIGLLPKSSHSQSSENEGCVIVLKDAEKSYEQGKLEKIPSILEACIASGFNREEKIKAYRLLTLTYLFDDNKEMAEKSIENMLKLDPEHLINASIDPIEFIHLYNEYRTEPIFTYGINGGVNISSVRLIEQYSLDNDNLNTAGSSNTYFNQSGLQGGLQGGLMLIKNMHLNIGVTFKTTKIRFTQDYFLNSFDNAADTLSSFGNLESIENHSWLRLPLNFTYDIKITPKVYTYIGIGGYVGLLVSAKSTLTRAYSASSSVAPVTGPPEDIKSRRNFWNYGLTGGLGFKYRIPRGNIFLDVRYNYGLKNLNIGDQYKSDKEMPVNQNLLYKYYSVDDNIIMNDLAFTIGYSRFFYNPKKKEKSKPKKSESVN